MIPDYMKKRQFARVIALGIFQLCCFLPDLIGFKKLGSHTSKKFIVYDR